MTAALFWEIGGWVGAALILVGFALISLGGTARTPHHLINLAGGILLLGASAVKDAWFSVALNAVWIVIALAALARAVLARLRPRR